MNAWFPENQILFAEIESEFGPLRVGDGGGTYGNGQNMVYFADDEHPMYGRSRRLWIKFYRIGGGSAERCALVHLQSAERARRVRFMNELTIANVLSDHRGRAMQRAVEVYGDVLSIASKQQTQITLQGNVETGFAVWGRARGGDQIGCLFPTRRVAQAYIDAIMAEAESPA